MSKLGIRNASNRVKIEALWDKVKEKKYKDAKLNMRLHELCEKARAQLDEEIVEGNKWRSASGEKRPYADGISDKHAKCYRCDIMLFEKEKDFNSALELAQTAVNIGIRSRNPLRWYEQKLDTLKEKQKER